MLTACFRSAARHQRRALSVLRADSGAFSEAHKLELADRGYVRGLRVLDEATVGGLRARLPLLFRGEFDTGVYPDEMHWREGISRQDAPREVCCGVLTYPLNVKSYLRRARKLDLACNYMMRYEKRRWTKTSLRPRVHVSYSLLYSVLL